MSEPEAPAPGVIAAAAPREEVIGVGDLFNLYLDDAVKADRLHGRGLYKLKVDAVRKTFDGFTVERNLGDFIKCRVHFGKLAARQLEDVVGKTLTVRGKVTSADRWGIAIQATAIVSVD